MPIAAGPSTTRDSAPIAEPPPPTSSAPSAGIRFKRTGLIVRTARARFRGLRTRSRRQRNIRWPDRRPKHKEKGRRTPQQGWQPIRANLSRHPCLDLDLDLDADLDFDVAVPWNAPLSSMRAAALWHSLNRRRCRKPINCFSLPSGCSRRCAGCEKSRSRSKSRSRPRSKSRSRCRRGMRT